MEEVFLLDAIGKIEITKTRFNGYLTVPEIKALITEMPYLSQELFLENLTMNKLDVVGGENALSKQQLIEAVHYAMKGMIKPRLFCRTVR